MEGVRRIRNVLDRFLETAQIGLFGIMVAVGAYQILVRYLFNRPSTVSEELLTYVFSWAAPKIKRALDVISECLIFFFGAVVMVYGGIQITSLTMAQKTASLGIPMGYVYTIVPVAGGMIVVYSVLNLVLMAGDVQEAEGTERSGIKGAEREKEEQK